MSSVAPKEDRPASQPTQPRERGGWARSALKGKAAPRLAGALALVCLACLAYGWWAGRQGRPGDGPADSWRQAQQALEAHDLAAAKAHLEECRAAWPLHAETHFLLARVSRRAGDLAAAQAQLAKAATLEWPPSDVLLEQLLLQAQSGNLGAVEGRLQKAIADFHPEWELIVEALLMGYLAVNSYPDVLYWADFWTSRNPKAWLPRLYRGRACQLGRMLDKAIADYRDVLGHLPDHPQARHWLAGALALDGQFRAALEEFEAVLRANPDDQAGLLGLAHCQFSLSRPEDARATLDRRSARHPDDAAGLLLRARLELADGNAARALTCLQKAEALSPNAP